MIQPQSPSGATPAVQGATRQITFQVSADRCMGGSVLLNASARVATKADAQAIAALFPKSARVRGTTLSGVQDEDGHYITVGYVHFQVHFKADGVTGSFNEGGLKRYRSFRRAADKLGFTTVWAPRFKDSPHEFQTDAEFESYLQTGGAR